MALGRLFTLLAVIAAFAVGCGGGDNGGGGGTGTSSSDQPGKGKPAVTIGTKDFTEEFVLGNLYAQALKAKGYKVNLKENIGATEITDKALTSGTIDAYPEYTGETTATVFGKNKLYKSAEETANEAKALYEKRGQLVSNPTPFEDVDAIAATKEFAQKNGLSEVGDLKKLSSFTLGARPETFFTFIGLRNYRNILSDANFWWAFGRTVLLLTVALNLEMLLGLGLALLVALIAQLASGKYTVLKDPQGVFGFQNILFVINKDKYDALGGTAFMEIINKVNALLTAEAMRSMNSAVDIDKKKPADVAKAFLQANGLA